jgi:hypothetical protein
VGVFGFQAEVADDPSVSGPYETGARVWVAKPDPEVTTTVDKPGEWNAMTL